MPKLHSPPPGRTYRATFTLPSEMAANLSRVAKRLGISQSALLAQLLADPLADLARLVDLVPANPKDITPDQVRRLRGQSVELIERRVREALDASKDIDPAPGLPL